jgi:hypothetical protein
MTVLGNKMAAELPEIKGRGIWSVGSNDVEVQVPFLSHEEAADEIAHLSQKFSETQRANFQKLLTNVEEVKKAGVVGNTSDFDSSEEIGVA